MCDEAYARTKAALTKHRGLVDILVAKLLDQETVSAKGSNPTPTPTPSPTPNPDPTPTLTLTWSALTLA